jgi:hypothetical protein
MGETAAMKRLYGLDASERQKLERMEESIRSVERRLAPETNTGTGPSTQAGGGCQQTKALFESGTRVADNDTTYPTLLKLHMDLMALALELDITRVITLSLSLGGSGGAPMRWLQWKDAAGKMAPIDAGHHNVTHGLQRGVENYREKIEVIDKWNFEQFAYLIGRLKAIDEGGSTALDNSILWYASDNGNGNGHTAVMMPFIIAGRAGGALKSGRYISYADAPKHQRLLTDFCHKLGVEVPTFGRAASAAGGSVL